ncbi:MAG: DUF262 domain-containing protein [Eubacteriales bacterium]
MENVHPLNYPINDFYGWYKRKELVLQPKFQRRDVWDHKAQSYLIDTILRRMPIPKLFIRETIDLQNNRTIREVVDGQQRLKAIISYLDGQIAVSSTDNKEYGNLLFYQLPDNVQKEFLKYRLSVDLLEGASDVDVLEVFSRLNSYTITLNAQEKRNAKYKGLFKQTVYYLGFKHYQFWLSNKILTSRQIARMLEAELVSELIIAMIYGIQSGKSGINEIYQKFDDSFVMKDELVKYFENIIDTISSIYPSGMQKSNLRRRPLFYSLFYVLYICMYEKGYKKNILPFEKLKSQIHHLDESITENWTNPRPPFTDFIRFSQRGTDNQSARETRHNFIMEYINK